MKCLILAAGRFGADLRAQIAAGREPRLDVFELANVLGADVLDYGDVEQRAPEALTSRLGSPGKSAALAALGFARRDRYDAYFTTGEDIGLPLAAMLRPSNAGCSHTMIAHTLFPQKKRLLWKVGRVGPRVDRMLVYSTSEERLAIDELHMAPEKVQRLYYHADEMFFKPDGRALEPKLICAAGQLLRDYDCLLEAVRGLDVRVEIAAGSPWIDSTLGPARELPPNVEWGKKNRYDLREMYARSALAVVPIKQNHYQTGIATILEMMAMGKCVIATRTHGQTDTIVDGETGVYVPPADPVALRSAITRMLASPDEAARIGRNARRFIEENAGLDRFVQKVADAVRLGHTTRFGAAAAP
jgi:glycosyltransferase involved in cell wall biosynthesis